MLQAEKRTHDTAKQTLIEFQQKNELLQRKVEDSDMRIVDLQGNVQRFVLAGFCLYNLLNLNFYNSLNCFFIIRMKFMLKVANSI